MGQGMQRRSYWLIGMDYGLKSFARCGGHRSISGMVGFM